MNQLVRCRCGRWTTYGLSCTSCRSTVVTYSEYNYEIEPLEEEDEDEDEDEPIE